MPSFMVGGLVVVEALDLVAKSALDATQEIYWRRAYLTSGRENDRGRRAPLKGSATGF